MPVNKRRGAEDLLSYILNEINWEELNPNNLQVSYDSLIETINKVLEELGIPKNAIKTDDKLSKETKDLHKT